MPQPSSTKIYLKITYLKFHSNFPGTSELSYWYHKYLDISVFAAAVTGNRDVAHTVVRGGANINAKDKDGKTALMIAVVNGHQSLVELLLERDADLTVKNEVSGTVQYWVPCHYCMVSVVQNYYLQ